VLKKNFQTMGIRPQTLAVRGKYLGRIHTVEKKLKFVGVS